MGDADGGTDYTQDDGLFERASRIYEVEQSASRHYETLRLHTVNIIVVATGAIVAYGLERRGGAGPVIPAVLVGLGIVGFIICARLGQAHYYHWYLAVKMRQIILRGRPKLVEKWEDVNVEYRRTAGFWRALDHEQLWQLIALLVPVSGAALLWLLRILPYLPN